jgi:hypothetical protein
MLRSQWGKATRAAMAMAVIACLCCGQRAANADEVWQPLGNGTNGEVNALIVDHDELIAAGCFTAATGQTVNQIARWDGSTWHPLGSGMNGCVHGLAIYQGELIAGGDFTTANGQLASRIARWDGTSWHALGNGMDSTVYALTVYGNDLIAGGSFNLADGERMNRIARWDGSTWHPMVSRDWWEFNWGNGSSDEVRALILYGGQLVAGGTTAGGLACWNGLNWKSGIGATGAGVSGSVHAFTQFNGELIVGGTFAYAGVHLANNIVRWNGTDWSTLGSGMGGSWFGPGTVFALTVYKGELVVGAFIGRSGGR